MELDKKALNIEMLKIAGFTCTGGIWTYPDGVDVDNGVPYFPESLDEIFRRLIPKLTDAQRARLPGLFSHDGIFTFHWFWEKPALALCLAIQELIRSEQ